MDEKKLAALKKLAKELVGQDGCYILMVAKADLRDPLNAQVWSEGPGPLVRGMVEIGRDFVIQRQMGNVKSIS